MGLLDDAIREHLELKRRRGADAEEVSRVEQEALGPPQRGEFAGASAPAEAAEPVDPDGPAEPAEPVEPADAAAVAPADETEWLEDEPEPAEEPVAGEPTAPYQTPHRHPDPQAHHSP